MPKPTQLMFGDLAMTQRELQTQIRLLNTRIAEALIDAQRAATHEEAADCRTEAYGLKVERDRLRARIHATAA